MIATSEEVMAAAVAAQAESVVRLQPRRPSEINEEERDLLLTMMLDGRLARAVRSDLLLS
jgi:hypothetical protein